MEDVKSFFVGLAIVLAAVWFVWAIATGRDAEDSGWAREDRDSLIREELGAYEAQRDASR